MKRLILACLFLSFSINISLFAYDYEWAMYGVEGGDFSEGLAPQLNSETSLYGYINSNGELAIPYKYKSSGSFHRGTAIVKDASGNTGIINRKGEYTLHPGNFEINESHYGYYIVKDKVSNLEALHNGTNFITPFEYTLINLGDFPFISAFNKDKIHVVINLISNEFYQNCDISGFGNIGYYIFDKDDKSKFKIYSFDGEPLNINELSVSPQSHEFYFDENKNRYGIRNADTKEIISNPKFLISKHTPTRKFWMGNIALVNDSVDKNNPFIDILIDENGKELFRCSSTQYLIPYKDYIFILDVSDFDKKVYLDYNGKEIKILNGYTVDKFAPGIYIGSQNGNVVVYLSNLNLLKKDLRAESYSDNMLSCYDTKKENYIYINCLTGKQIGPYEQASPFTEGIAVVKNNRDIFFIDKNGQEFHLPSHLEVGSGYSAIPFSEGVIPVFDRNNIEHGYIYSPIGAKKYSYNQKNVIVNKDLWNRYFNEGNDLFNKKQYANSMDKYYQCMMIDPQEVTAFNNYSACLYNLGRYEEAITSVDVTLQNWPNNNFALSLRKKINESIKALEYNEETESLINSSYSVWDAIGNFANNLAQATGTFIQSNSYNYYSFSNSINDSNNSTSALSGDNLTSQYSNWERLAEKHYNSLTNLGYSTTSRSGSKSGSSGGKISSGNYIQMKRSLSEAQSNMRRIRLKAKQQGITIQQSRWETARVNY